jgi:hypothetical protein
MLAGNTICHNWLSRQQSMRKLVASLHKFIRRRKLRMWLEDSLINNQNSKKPKGPDALRLILNDFEANANGQSFLNYYDAQGEKIFLQF